MPGLYRSKSVRRFEETNNRLTNFIEKDNIKVLATASAQLFISAPHLEKWYKSSTGTICFLKDFTKNSTYYFRLYSLMQGQLWEQEIKSPFDYRKANTLFHCLKADRFNYGFKFICEDESERFFSVINKFSSIISNHPSSSSSASTSSLTKRDSISNNNETAATNAITDCLDRTTVSTRTFSQNESNGVVVDVSKSNTRISRRFEQNLNYSAVVSGIQSQHQLNNNDTNNETRTSMSHRSSRRPAYSSDRKTTEKRRIDKSDISCPFRCSCDDLSLGEMNTQADTAANTPIDIVKKYSTVVKQLSSIQSQHQQQQKIVSEMVKKAPLASDEIELEFIKELLYKFNVPISNELVREVKDYIGDYGGVERFKRVIDGSENERKKLNAFVAACNAIVINNQAAASVRTSPNVSPANNGAGTQRFNTAFPTPASSVYNSPNTPEARKITSSKPTSYQQTTSGSQPRILSLINQNRSKKLNFNLLTPTSTPTTSSNRQLNSNQSPIVSNSMPKSSAVDRTPIRTNPLASASNYQQRMQTPSPPKQTVRQHLNSLGGGTAGGSGCTTTPILDANAPPKPPRRSSLKMNNS